MVAIPGTRVCTVTPRGPGTLTLGRLSWQKGYDITGMSCVPKAQSEALVKPMLAKVQG